VGFLVEGDADVPTRWRISNFERGETPGLARAEPTFAIERWFGAGGGPPAPDVWVDGARPIGKKAEQSLRELRALLTSGKPDLALIGKGVELLREAARSNTSIGQQVMAIALTPDRPYANATFAYYSKDPTSTYFGPTVVTVVPGATGIIEQVKIEALGGEPISGPNLRPTELCWCASGKQFRRCHGRRMKPPRVPPGGVAGLGFTPRGIVVLKQPPRSGSPQAPRESDVDRVRGGDKLG
jgi:hypothetical protein